MNIHIEKIQKSLQDIKESMAEIKKEYPNLYLYLDEFYLTLPEKWDVIQTTNHLQNQLNQWRLRKITLDKLTPQDIEILGLYKIVTEKELGIK